MTSTVRAAYIERLGPPDLIRVGDLPEPPLSGTEVRVEVAAVAVNPVDAYIRSGRYPTPTPFPFVVGRDLAGTVVAVGAGVAGFAPGDRVWANSLGHDGRQGSFAQRVAVPADRLYHLPDGVDAEAAVAAVHPAATAHIGLFREARLRPGDTVVVGGGAGNVGTAAVVLAAASGARVIATARPNDADWCRAAGAADVVDYRDPALAERLAEHTPGGVDVYWDTSGHHDLAGVLPLLADGGRVVVTAAQQPETALPIRQLYLHDIAVRGFVISKASAADLASAARTINRLLAAGRLPVRIADTLGLDHTADAHRRIEAGTVDGRLVIRPAG